MEEKTKFDHYITVSSNPIENDYNFIKEIGRGSSGVCYLAQKKQNKNFQLRCIKTIQKSNTSTKYPKQAYFLERLSHPGLAKLYQFYENQNNFYIVTEYCKAGDLFDYLDSQGPLSEQQAKDLFIQMVSVLKYCHFMKICHRDLKPENFLLSSLNKTSGTPEIKLIDFDLAFEWKSDMKSEIIEAEGHRIKGTPFYIAPQIIEGPYDQRCDIWSLGIVLYVILTGRYPFKSLNKNKVLSEIRSKKLNLSQNEEFNQLSLLVQDLINRMLKPVESRISIDEIFNHPWMRIVPSKRKILANFSHIVRFSKFSKLKKIVASFLASYITAKQTKNISILFKALDKNNDGFISVEELEDGLQNFNMNENSKQQLHKMLKFAQGNNYMIDYTEFTATFITERYIQAQANLLKVFKMIDNDNSGAIDGEQMKKTLIKFGAKKKPFKQLEVNTEKQKIFQKVDKNQDGLIDFQEFKAAIINDFQF